MIYADVRQFIRNGDVVSVYRRSIFAICTKFVQRLSGAGDLAGVTHNGVAWWLEGRLFCVEMNGVNNVLRPMSHYQGLKILIHACPCDRVAMARLFEHETENAYVYSWQEILRIGYRLIFNKGKGAGRRTEAVCSTFVSRWLIGAGWVPPASFPDMPSPCEIASALGRPAFVINPT